MDYRWRIIRVSRDDLTLYFIVILEKCKNHYVFLEKQEKVSNFALKLSTFIYKSLKNIGTIEANEAEWLQFGHNQKLYPNLMGWTENVVRLLKKLK